MDRTQTSLHFLEDEYLRQRGITKKGQIYLIDALREVLESKEPYVQDDSSVPLSEAEQDVLKQGGLRLDGRFKRDVEAETALKYAELVASSMDSVAVAEMLGLTPARIRQMVSSREIYTFLLNGKRLIPPFQFHNGALVNNIRRVLPSLRQALHPVGVDQWFRASNSELRVDENTGDSRSPLDWLTEGRDPDQVAYLASYI